MPDKFRTSERYGEAFWRKHHEAWQQSALNQREYCEAQGIPLEAFGNWRAKFKVEPQPPAPKLLYRRRGLSHTLSHRLSHSLSHMTNDLPGPIVPPAREGHRRTFSEADKRRIVEETARPGATSRDHRRDPANRGVCIMTLLPPGVKVHLAFGFIDMRKGIDGLAMLVQGVLRQDPFSGHLFVFRGRKANLIKIVYWDGTGLCLFTKRLEHGVFLWPSNVEPGETLLVDLGAVVRC